MTPVQLPELQPWVGLVHVVGVGRKNPLAGKGGAYANVVALASSGEEFARLVRRAFELDHLVVTEIEDVEPVAARRERWGG